MMFAVPAETPSDGRLRFGGDGVPGPLDRALDGLRADRAAATTSGQSEAVE